MQKNQNFKLVLLLKPTDPLVTTHGSIANREAFRKDLRVARCQRGYNDMCDSWDPSLEPRSTVLNRSVARRLACVSELDFIRLGPFVSSHNLERHFVARIESFEPSTDHGRMMHEDVLP